VNAWVVVEALYMLLLRDERRSTESAALEASFDLERRAIMNGAMLLFVVFSSVSAMQTTLLNIGFFLINSRTLILSIGPGRMEWIQYGQ